MKKLILVIGRSGSGKDTLVRHAQTVFGTSSIPSYTDRPMRVNETNGVEHTFLTTSEFEELLDKETIFAYTKIGETGYRYCTTIDMLNRMQGDAIFYIIDPAGYDVCKVFGDKIDINVIYVHADDEVRKKRANSRNGDSTTWEKRCQDEDAQFTAFEKSQAWDVLIDNNGMQEDAEREFIAAVKNIITKVK